RLQLGRRHHLHGARDLLRRADAADPLPDDLRLFGHRGWNSGYAADGAAAGTAFHWLALNDSISPRRALAVSSSRAPVSLMVLSDGLPVARRYSIISDSKRLMSSTGTSSMRPLLTAKMLATCSSIGQVAAVGCFSTSTVRSPRASWARVPASRSEANWAKASSSRYWARSRRSLPATFFMAFVWALPPTRLTEMPTLMAGRTPA